MHKFHQASCDRQAQTISFCVSGTVTTDKPLHQLLAGNVQRISGSVAECNLHFLSGLL